MVLRNDGICPIDVFVRYDAVSSANILTVDLRPVGEDGTTSLTLGKLLAVS